MENIIIQNAKLMDVVVSQHQAQQLLTYANLIHKWNKTYNLTAIKTLDEVIKIHILDSLSIVNFIQPTTLLDVGSGAGLPSVVLAIMLPDLQVSAIDSVGKKCRFMQFVKTSLSLENFNVINDRVENINAECFQQITSRAFATIDDNIELSSHLLCDGGKFLLMKGDNWQLENSKHRIISHALTIPLVSDKRYILEITLD